MHRTNAGRPPKHGKYSNALREWHALAQNYEASRASDNLLDLCENLALMQAGVQTQLERAAQGDVPEFRKRILALLEDGEADKALDLARNGVEADRLSSLAFAEAERFAIRVEAAHRTAAEVVRVQYIAKLVLWLRNVIDEESRRWVGYPSDKLATQLIKRFDMELLPCSTTPSSD